MHAFGQRAAAVQAAEGSRAEFITGGFCQVQHTMPVLAEEGFGCLYKAWLQNQHRQKKPLLTVYYRIIEPLRLEKTSKIIRSNHHPNTTMLAKPCPEVPYLDVF